MPSASCGLSHATSPGGLDWLSLFLDRILVGLQADGACHTVNNVMTMHLAPLSPGARTWNEEQSRQTFQWVSRVVVPGYEDSLLIKHPLDEKAGGDLRHGGGQQDDRGFWPIYARAEALDVPITAFVLIVIGLCPLVAMALLWTLWDRAGLLLLAVSMAASLLFGLYHHFVAAGPDHISGQVLGFWATVFVLSAYGPAAV
jgi:hypothetical protein